jgi:methionine-rich copper-binding protein CopC
MTMRLPIALSVLALGIVHADAHAMLDHASPPVGGTVARAPASLSLVFTEPLEPAFSGATVRNAAGQRVDAGSTHLARGNKMELQVPLKTLPPGTYKVEWHVLSVDTHKTQGSFSFTVGAH